MRSLIQKQFGDWQPSRNLPQFQLPSVSQAKQGGIFLVNQPQLTQSYVEIGHLGGKFDSPDYAALDVLNRVLNGFGGRLFNSVRSRQGLAYTVYGSWSPRYDYPGVFSWLADKLVLKLQFLLLVLSVPKLSVSRLNL